MRNLSNKYVIIGEKEDRTFPLPSEDLEHKLRYTNQELSRTEKLHLASIIGAYNFLINTTKEDSSKVISQIRKARKLDVE